MLSPLMATVLVFVILTALVTALLRDVLAAIIAFAAYSLGVSVIWVLLQAPDVALTEAAVGAGAMTILLLVTIAKTVRAPGDRLVERVKLGPLTVAGAFALAIGATVPALPRIGDPNAAVPADAVTTTYLADAYSATGVENVVTAVLAAYRGFDTFGEVVVVFAAGTALLVVLKREVFA
ncbi:DUF4040 domain-containing protein [Halorhabdus sp. CBA1104]|uniref:DUF4040 domain-containing protein n=1 Tax=unclassified Halorhabdus TaxID=2621901 RepID=UPI0012B1F9C6|nr:MULTISPECIES: DUF4040 domain-containing protein [unclassified Halorhabdus]QGN06636.1 DUF4040 domain-containing protein [Halorhabdus sp. CBA1104]